jgi:hypothetical protein
VDLFVLQRRLRGALVDAAPLNSVTDAVVIQVWSVVVLVAGELGPEMAILPWDIDDGTSL